MADRQVSRGKTRDLRCIYPPHLRSRAPDDIGLRVFWPSRPRDDASHAIPVRRAAALPAASFRPRLAAAALAVRLTVPVIKVRRGLERNNAARPSWPSRVVNNQTGSLQ